jgi:DNA-binding NarL/FixJ family response regulator
LGLADRIVFATQPEKLRAGLPVVLKITLKSMCLQKSLLILAKTCHYLAGTTSKLTEPSQWKVRAVVESEVSPELTTREQQILALLAQGRTSKEMATVLNISVATIGSHRRNLCRKLNLHSTAELVHYAARGRSQTSNSGR